VPPARAALVVGALACRSGRGAMYGAACEASPKRRGVTAPLGHASASAGNDPPYPKDLPTTSHKCPLICRSPINGSISK
jgi:hypothetical protein